MTCPLCDRQSRHGGMCRKCVWLGWLLTLTGAAVAFWLLGLVATWEDL